MSYSLKFRVPLTNLVEAVERECDVTNFVVETDSDVDVALNKLIQVSGLAELKGEFYRADICANDSRFRDIDCVGVVAASFGYLDTTADGAERKKHIQSEFNAQMKKLQKILGI